MNLAVVAAIAALSTATTSATADELIIHTVSYHSAYNKPTTTTELVTINDQLYTQTYTYSAYNNQNWGIGYRTDSGYEVGAYYNSYRKLSLYIATSWMYNEFIGVYAGLATGYRDVLDFPVAPIGGFILQFPIADKINARLLVQPPLGSKFDGVIHLTFGYKF